LGVSFQHVPQVVVQFHLHQHVAGQKNPLHGALLAVDDLRHRLGGNHHPAHLVLQPEGLHAALDRLAHLALKARVGVQDVPLEALVALRRAAVARRVVPILLPFCSRFAACNSSAIMLSFRNPPSLSAAMQAQAEDPVHHKEEQPKMNTAMITTVVVACTSLREGVTTLRISARTSLRKRVNSFHCPSRPRPNFESGPWLLARPLYLRSPLPFFAVPLLLSLPCFQFLRARRPAWRIPVLNLAGAEGFEPPSSVLETDSLAVELTPLKAGVSDQFQGAV
jgi:hypothetical protein